MTRARARPAPPPPATLGERLRARRVELGLTQVQLAERCASLGGGEPATWQPTISRLEGGAAALTTTLETLAEALGCDVALTK